MKTSNLRSALWLFAALPMVGCQQVFFVEVEVPQVCQSLASQQFEGVPPEMAVAMGGKVEREFEYDVSNLLGEIDFSSLEGEAQLKSMSMTKLLDSPALTFINSAKVELLTPDGTDLPTLKVIDYVKDANEDGEKLEFTGDKIDLLPYLRAGKVKLRAALEGTMPTEPWAADFDGCFYMRARYYYYETLQNGAFGGGN
jgi:hypothetical protein